MFKRFRIVIVLIEIRYDRRLLRRRDLSLTEPVLFDLIHADPDSASILGWRWPEVITVGETTE